MRYENYDKVLSKSKIFQGMSLDEIHLAIEKMNGRVKKYKKR